jgi:pimeloyl-ACP methyl ester carboxylesterase
MATADLRMRLTIAGCLTVVSIGAAQGQQTPAPDVRTVTVNGRTMRVSVAGLERRTMGEPVLILEAGAGAGLDEWSPAIPELARLAPVLAYDRHGIGQSEPDTQPRTIRRVATALHDLVRTMRVAPPYVLVGHSWGGILIRGFSELYGPEVAGLVYIETMDVETTRQELAGALPPAARKDALEPREIPTIPPDTPPGLRAEYENLQQNIRTDFAEARGLRPAGSVPVAVVIAAPPGRLKHPGDVLMRLQIKHQANWALDSSNGLLIVSGAVGHNVAKADPSLVVQAVRHVLNHANRPAAK